MRNLLTLLTLLLSLNAFGIGHIKVQELSHYKGHTVTPVSSNHYDKDKAIQGLKTTCESPSKLTGLGVGRLVGTEFCSKEHYSEGMYSYDETGKEIKVNNFFYCQAVCLRKL